MYPSRYFLLYNSAMKEQIDVRSFFTNSKFVWTSENFQNLILSKYESSQKDQSVSFSNLQDIESNVDLEKFIFEDVDTFLEKLAQLIKNQADGKEGDLLNDSSANTFFVRGKDRNLYSVLVRWEEAQGLWRCGAYLQKDLKLPNIRIFHP